MFYTIKENFESRKHKLVEKYIMANKLHKMYLEREVAQTGVYRSQHQILMYIAANPNASQKEIATRQHVSTATIAVSLKKLEKGGYISRSADKKDNRFNQICITPKGRAVVEGSIQIFQKVEDALFAHFTEEELNQFEGYIDRVRLNLEYLLQENSVQDPENKEESL